MHLVLRQSLFCDELCRLKLIWRKIFAYGYTKLNWIPAQFHHLEISSGNIIWKYHLETSSGKTIWKHHLEISYGNIIWKINLILGWFSLCHTANLKAAVFNMDACFVCCLIWMLVCFVFLDQGFYIQNTARDMYVGTRGWLRCTRNASQTRSFHLEIVQECMTVPVHYRRVHILRSATSSCS